MNLGTESRKQSYEGLVNFLEEYINSDKIKEKVFHMEENNRYKKIGALCTKLFQYNPTNARLEIEKPSSDKPFVRVTVYMDEFELNASNKLDFIELIQLADEIIFYGDEEDYFHIAFYVDDIWTE